MPLDDKVLDIVRAELAVAAAYEGFDKVPEQVEQFSHDPVWSLFGFDNKQFLTYRNVGNYYTSIFRKIGDMYERMVRAVVADRLDIPAEHLDYTFIVDIDGNEQARSLDVAIDARMISDPESAARVREILRRLNDGKATDIAVIEVRSCYMIGDSKRIQADETAAVAARAAGLLPILMIFCTTSLPSPVNRLRRTWCVTEGAESYELLKELTGYDLYASLAQSRGAIAKAIEPVLAVFDANSPGKAE